MKRLIALALVILATFTGVSIASAAPVGFIELMRMSPSNPLNVNESITSLAEVVNAGSTAGRIVAVIPIVSGEILDSYSVTYNTTGTTIQCEVANLPTRLICRPIGLMNPATGFHVTMVHHFTVTNNYTITASADAQGSGPGDDSNEQEIYTVFP